MSLSSILSSDPEYQLHHFSVYDLNGLYLKTNAFEAFRVPSIFLAWVEYIFGVRPWKIII